MKIFIIILLVILSCSTLICSETADIATEQPTIQNDINSIDNNLLILDKLHSLYYDVMIFFGILVAFIGILIPLFINFYQTKKLKIEKENLKQELLLGIKSEIKSHFDLYEDKFETEVKKMETDFKEKISNMELEFEKQSDAMRGMAFHMQGRFEFDKQYYADCLKSYIQASNFYLKGEDYSNFQRVNNLIIDRCFPKLFSSDFEIISDLEEKVINLIKHLKKYNDKGRYTDLITNMKKELKKAKKRERATQT